MAERRYYRVAGWMFSITAEAQQLALLSSYEPFASDEQEACNLLFHLTVASFAEPADIVPLFTDGADPSMPRIELYRISSTNGWLFRFAPHSIDAVCAALSVSADFHEATLHILDDNFTRFAMDNAAMLLYAFTTATKHTLEMHASVVVKDHRGYLFLGHSGTGKSTHARLWQEVYPDAWLLNDDNPILRVLPDGEVRVYGSPWSGKTPCYRPHSTPIGGIVQLRQAPVNTMRRLRLPEAYAYLLSSSSGLKFVPRMMDALYETITSVLQAIPVYLLDCLPDTDAACLCHDTMTR